MANTNMIVVPFLLLLVVANLLGESEAGQGCPFDNGSCQEYCNQQGCGMGYCGHFAWIQCICRKCGNQEWSYYDKIRFATGYQNQSVNQTELESLKLNQSTPHYELEILGLDGDVTEISGPTTTDNTTTNTGATKTAPSPATPITPTTVAVPATESVPASASTTSASTRTTTTAAGPEQLDSGASETESTTITISTTARGPRTGEKQADEVSGSSTETSNEPSGTLLVPDLTNDEHNPEANNIDEADTEKLLEIAEQHYNRLKQNETTATTTTPATTRAGDDANTNSPSETINRTTKRKRNTISAGQIREMMYRI